MDTIERIEAREKLMVGLAGRGVSEERRKRLAAKHLSPDFPLSLLLARGLITARQHAAGMWFGALYARLFGAPHAGAALWREPRGLRAISEVDELAAERAHHAAITALDALPAPTLARAVVHRHAVYLEHDWWVREIVAGEMRHRHRVRLAALRLALDALAAVRETAQAARMAS